MGLPDIEGEALYRRIFIIVVGTFVGTLALAIFAMLGHPAASAGQGAAGSFISALWKILLFVILFAIFAMAVCALLAVPVIILFVPIFNGLMKCGCRERHAAMLTAGLLAPVATIAVIWSFHRPVFLWLGFPWSASVGYLLMLVSVGIAETLAWVNFRSPWRTH